MRDPETVRSSESNPPAIPSRGSKSGGVPGRRPAYSTRPSAAIKRSKPDDKPRRLSSDSMWFQFESALPLHLTPWALAPGIRSRAGRTYGARIEPISIPGDRLACPVDLSSSVGKRKGRSTVFPHSLTVERAARSAFPTAGRSLVAARSLRRAPELGLCESVASSPFAAACATDCHVEPEQRRA